MASPTLLLCPPDAPDASEPWELLPEERPDVHEGVGTARILVVDDEAIVRSFIARLLEEHGYQVDVAENGVDALRIALAHPTGFDLVISDLRMPAMSGWELAEQLRARWPTLPILYISGYDLARTPPEPASFLRKPFEPLALVQHVARMLGGV